MCVCVCSLVSNWAAAFTFCIALFCFLFLFCVPSFFFMNVTFYLAFYFLQQYTTLPSNGQAGVAAAIVTVFFGNYILSFVYPNFDCFVSVYFYFCQAICVLSKVIRRRQLGGIGIGIRLCRSSLSCRWCRLARRFIFLRSSCFLFRLELVVSLRITALVLRGQKKRIVYIEKGLKFPLRWEIGKRSLRLDDVGSRKNPLGENGNKNEYG